MDECLVPCNICDPSARVLRDVELAVLLQAMVSRGLIVTLVLDSCHSGGATRGRTAAVARHLPAANQKSRSPESAVASREHLIATWRSLERPVTRHLFVDNWLPASNDYILFAACQARERAIESPLEGGQKRGVFTYWLLETLRREGTELTCRELYELLLARVHGENSNQTPMLMGDGDRMFLGVERRPGRDMVLVMRRDDKKGRILLNTGRSQGVREGEQFAIYPPRADTEGIEGRQALVEVRQAGSANSWAEVVRQILPGPIEPGAQGVLVGAGSLSLQRAVAVVSRDQIAVEGQEQILDCVRRALMARTSGFTRLAAEGETPDFQVVVNDDGKLEIWDGSGEILPNLQLCFAASDPLAASKLAQHLDQLARFQTIRQLENLRPSPDLARFQVRFLADSAVSFHPPGNMVELSRGDKINIEICNGSSRTLNIALLNLRPDWTIKQVWPGGSTYPIEPRQRKCLPVDANLPADLAEADDILKVFATRGATNFRWLELPQTDQLGPNRGGTKGVLDQLFQMMSQGAPVKRKLTPSHFPDEEWITRQLVIRVRR